MSPVIVKTRTIMVYSYTPSGAHYTLYGVPIDDPNALIEITVYASNPGGHYNIYNTTTLADQKVALFGGTQDAYQNILTWYRGGATEHLLAYDSNNPLSNQVFRVLSYSTLNPTDPHAVMNTINFSDWGILTDAPTKVLKHTNGDGTHPD